MKKYILEIIVFVCGANLMIFELVGSRLLAPYLGGGIFVWSSIIGIILGSLSIGYWLGGKIADKKATNKNLSIILLVLAFSVGTTVFYKDWILIFISTIFNLQWGAIIASIILFSSSSIVFGIVSPYAAILKLKESRKIGSTVGNLYAISTAGSILGTFLAGFFLIPKVGSINVLILISTSLFLLAIISFFENKKYAKQIGAFVLFLVVFNYFSKVNISASDVNEDIDTPYSRVMIYDEKNQNGDIIRLLKTGSKGAQSGMSLENPTKLVFEYAKFYDLVFHFNPQFKKTLLLGGGGYVYPKHFLKKYNEATIDVVEIDPQMKEISKKYFYLKEDSRMKIIHEDARVFLNKNKNRYDIIFKDTFNAHYSIPFQLTTREMIKKEYDSLNENGIVAVNVIAAVSGKESGFLNLEYNTYKSIFPQVFLFKVDKSVSDEKLQNISLIAVKSKKEVSFVSEEREFQDLLEQRIKSDFKIKDRLLTDDFAPVEYINLSSDF